MKRSQKLLEAYTLDGLSDHLLKASSDGWQAVPGSVQCVSKKIPRTAFTPGGPEQNPCSYESRYVCIVERVVEEETVAVTP